MAKLIWLILALWRITGPGSESWTGREATARLWRMSNFYYPVDRDIIAIMFYYVYVLQSKKDGGLYIGYTGDLKARFQQHNHGLNFSTKSKIPWELIHYEAYRDKEDAKRREQYLKTSQGSRLLKRMLKEYFYKIRK